jgi:hypothetical protein
MAFREVDRGRFRCHATRYRTELDTLATYSDLRSPGHP